MENKNKFKNIKFTMHKLTSISLIQQWHSTKHFKMFLCLNCPILGELQYLTRDLKKLHIKVNFLLNVCVGISGPPCQKGESLCNSFNIFARLAVRSSYVDSILLSSNSQSCWPVAATSFKYNMNNMFNVSTTWTCNFSWRETNT